MKEKMRRLCNPKEYAEAGYGELLVMPPLNGFPPMTVQKKVLEAIAHGISMGALIFLFGETGTGKSAILETLSAEPKAWESMCRGAGIPYKPLRVYWIDMVLYETPGELLAHRAIGDGRTYDEESELVAAIREADRNADTCYNLIWLKELGRVISSSVMGGLLNFFSVKFIRLPNGDMIDASRIAWVADSNYNTEETSVHTLVELDCALARRAIVNLGFDYLPPEEEVRILRFFVQEGFLPPVEEKRIVEVVQLGQSVRAQRRRGNLLSVTPPTLYGYFGFLRMVHKMKELPVQDVAKMTLLGFAKPSEREQLTSLCSEVFGLRKTHQDDAVMGGDLF